MRCPAKPASDREAQQLFTIPEGLDGESIDRFMALRPMPAPEAQSRFLKLFESLFK